MAEHVTRDDGEWEEFARWLESEGYGRPLPLANDRWAAIIPRPYNLRLCTGEVGDRFGILDGWCYDDPTLATHALVGWWLVGGEGEPAGWFRHPTTGRRVARSDGEIGDDGHPHAKGETYTRW